MSVATTATKHKSAVMGFHYHSIIFDYRFDYAHATLPINGDTKTILLIIKTSDGNYVVIIIMFQLVPDDVDDDKFHEV